MSNNKFKIGDIIVCVNSDKLRPTSRNKPPVRLDKRYIVQDIITCDKGCCNLIDIGFYCQNRIETMCGYQLDDDIWWMSASRFIKDNLNKKEVILIEDELQRVCHSIEKELK